MDELDAIVERTQRAALSSEDHAKLKAAMDTLAFLTAELQTSDAKDSLTKLITEMKSLLRAGAPAPPPTVFAWLAATC